MAIPIVIESPLVSSTAFPHPQPLCRGEREAVAVTPPLITPAFLTNPYPTYAALREAGPLHWSEEFFGGAWLLTRHTDIEAVLRDDVHFSAQRTGGWVMRCAQDDRAQLQSFQSLFARAMLFLDAPDHTRLRSVMNAGFRADALERIRPDVERWIDTRLSTCHGPFDFMAQIARPLPAYVIATLMGIEPADSSAHETFMAWADDLAAFIGAPQPSLEQAHQAQTRLLAMAQYFEQIIATKRRQPDDGLVSRLIQGQAQGAVHSHIELLAQCAMLLFAGIETTRNFLGNALHAALTQPGAWAQLAAQPELLPNAIRELLRYDSPVQYTGRRVKADLIVHGQALARGDLVIALIGAANRDERIYRAPDELNFNRRAAPMLSFGSGAHVCIGAALTLMEAQMLFGKLLRRTPPTLAHATAQWNGNPLYRGLRALWLVDGG